MRRCELTAAARRDLDQIVDYYVIHADVDVALCVWNAFDDAFAAIGRNPGFGHPRPDLTPHDVLFWKVGKYYLVVTVPKRRPFVSSASSHGSRDVKRLLRERFG